jgi:hypothetical protein
VSFVGIFLIHPRSAPAGSILSVAAIAALANLAIYIVRTSDRFHEEYGIDCPRCGLDITEEARWAIHFSLGDPRLTHLACRGCRQSVLDYSMLPGVGERIARRSSSH